MPSTNLDDILYQIGLQRHAANDPYRLAVPALAVFGAGIVTGAAVAMLTAPKSGRELRGDIADGATQLRDRVQTALPGVPDPASSRNAIPSREAMAK